MLHHLDELKDKLLILCDASMRKAQGLAFLLIMMEFTNHRLDCIKILQLHDHEGEEEHGYLESSLTELEYVSIVNTKPDLPVQMTDTKTLIDCTKRLRILRNLEKHFRFANDLSRLQDVCDEIDQINAFLNETRYAHTIKTFCSQQKINAYHTVERNISNFLKRVKAKDENLYYQLKAHIKLGYQCAWVDD